MIRSSNCASYRPKYGDLETLLTAAPGNFSSSSFLTAAASLVGASLAALGLASCAAVAGGSAKIKVASARWTNDIRIEGSGELRLGRQFNAAPVAPVAAGRSRASRPSASRDCAAV